MDDVVHETGQKSVPNHRQVRERPFLKLISTQSILGQDKDMSANRSSVSPLNESENDRGLVVQDSRLVTIVRKLIVSERS